MGVPPVLEEAGGLQHPGRGLWRRHGHHRCHGGALIGALHGAAWIPARWHNNIENGWYGRDELVQLVRQLAGMDKPQGDCIMLYVMREFTLMQRPPSSS